MIEQLIIACCGMASIWLTNDPRESWRRWACIIGLIAQPFWMFATYQAAQWGIFALSFVYAVAWARGVKHHWLRKVGAGDWVDTATGEPRVAPHKRPPELPR